MVSGIQEGCPTVRLVCRAYRARFSWRGFAVQSRSRLTLALGQFTPQRADTRSQRVHKGVDGLAKPRELLVPDSGITQVGKPFRCRDRDLAVCVTAPGDGDAELGIEGILLGFEATTNLHSDGVSFGHPEEHPNPTFLN